MAEYWNNRKIKKIYRGSQRVKSVHKGAKKVLVYKTVPKGLLTKLTIPNTVTRLTTNMLRDYDNVKSLVIPNSVYCLEGGCLNMNQLNSSRDELRNVIIPESVNTFERGDRIQDTLLRSEYQSHPINFYIQQSESAVKAWSGYSPEMFRVYLQNETHNVYYDYVLRSYKKGVCGNFSNAAELTGLSKRIHWWYNWGANFDTKYQDTMNQENIDYMPLLFNTNVDVDSVISYIKNNIARIYYIAVLNEPNHIAQSNTTPRQAAQFWVQVERIAAETGVKIVGPALAWSGDNMTEDEVNLNDPIIWMDKFIQEFKNLYGREPRYDYINYHCYVGDLGGFSASIERLYKYEKPIWITEFNYYSNGNGTEQDQINFINQVVPWLESNDMVYRYAWFLGAKDKEQVYSLVNTNGTLTSVGQAYLK